MSAPASRWARWAAGVVALWLAGWGVLAVFELQPQPLRLALVFAAVALLGWRIDDLAKAQRRPQWSGHDPEMSIPQRGDPRSTRLHRLLKDCTHSPHAADELRDTLNVVVDARLLDHHGVRRSTDPERATELLGTALVLLLDSPTGVLTSTPAQLAAAVDRIESL